MGPSRSKVIYDDDCRLCTNFKDWLESRDGDNQLEFEGVSKHSKFADGLGFMDSAGKEAIGIRAVLIAVGRTGGLVGLSARFMSAWPFYWLLTPLYRVFASNRKKLNKFFDHKND